jgi:hypothetical protein
LLPAQNHKKDLKQFITIIAFFLVSTCMYAQKGWAQPGAVDYKIVKSYPNPAVNFITFDISKPIERGYNIQVLSFLGRKVLTVQVTANKVTVNISELNRGVYVYQLRDQAGKIIETNKFYVSK